MPASPSKLNYFVGKGTCTFQIDGETTARDIGNAPEVELTPNVERLDHFSSRTGTRSKDRSVIVEKSGTLRVVLDEITPENLALHLAGTVTTDTAGTKTLEIMDNTETTGQFVLTGTNDVGQKMTMTLPNVSFTADGGFSFISDEWGRIEIVGEVLVDSSSSFGNIVFTDAS